MLKFQYCLTENMAVLANARKHKIMASTSATALPRFHYIHAVESVKQENRFHLSNAHCIAMKLNMSILSDA